MPRFADSIEEATHRYPTSIHWGRGYFNDGFKYLVADSDAAAFAFARDKSKTLTLTNLQKQVEGHWTFINRD